MLTCVKSVLHFSNRQIHLNVIVAQRLNDRKLGLRTVSTSQSQRSAQSPAEGSQPRFRRDDETADKSTRRVSGGIPTTGSSIGDAVITTLVGLGAVFFGGIAYVAWYKKNVLDKMELAFARGYDPALELASAAKRRNASHQSDASPSEPVWPEHVRRREQDLIDRVIRGAEAGQYYMLLGPKGTGKGTMILDAMQAVQAEGVAMCDAHPDLEVFRLRLGKALNYEYNEDTQTGLFQRRDPREAGPSLDIERALNKLEKVALRHTQRTGRPLILVINNVHYFKNDDDGKNMLLQLQYRAETWAAGGIMTLVFSTDDFWPYLLMKKVATRLQVVAVGDLSLKDAARATSLMRLNMRRALPDAVSIQEAVSVVGGRLSYLSKIARAQDVQDAANNILAVETAWLQSQIGLIPDCDDDVMDEQKWSSCSWLLLREFVQQRREDERERRKAVKSGKLSPDDLDELPLPKIPYYKCRQIMTRPDFLEGLDRANIIAIDTDHNVTPDSLLILRAAQEVVETSGFNKLLDDVRNRVDEIESLHRTRELTFKDVNAGDRIRVSVDKGNALLIEF